MEKIKQKAKEFNQTAYDIFNEDGDYDFNKLCDFISVPDEDINKLEELIGITIPSELKLFYKQIGKLTNFQNTDGHAFLVEEPKILIANITRRFEGRKISFGLIDTFIAYWGFDRPEFQNYGEYDGLTEEETKYINNNYKYIGHWFDDDIIEGAYFLFFDKKGSFYKIYYHQDNFYDTVTELRKLLSEEVTTTKNLEVILSEALEKVKETMIIWNE